jgi:hypothetical protein
MSDKTKKSSLTDADIKSGRAIGRRAFLLGTLGGTTALAACVPATGITDADGGAYADPVGAGRGGRTGYTGVTDSDGGRYADPVNAGRGRSCTDSDVGGYADPVGRGRRC